MARFSSQQDVQVAPDSPEEEARKKGLLVQDPDAAALQGANINQDMSQVPRFTTQRRAMTPEIQDDPNAQVHSESSPERKSGLGTVPTGLGSEFDPRQGAASDPNMADMQKRIAAIPELEKTRDEALHQPTGLGHKIGGIAAAIGGTFLGANPLNMYDLAAHGPQREAARPAAQQLQTTQDMLGAMKVFEPEVTSRVTAEASRQASTRPLAGSTAATGKPIPGSVRAMKTPDGRTELQGSFMDNDGNIAVRTLNPNEVYETTRGVLNSSMTVADALANGMTEVPWASGGTKDLRSLDPNMVISKDNQNKFYMGSQRESNITAGNEVGRIGQFQKNPSDIVPVGPAKTETDSIRTAPIGTDAQGHPITAPLPSKSVPTTPGFGGSPAPAQATPPAPAVPQMQDGVPSAAAVPPAPQGLAARRTPPAPTAPVVPTAAKPPAVQGPGGGAKVWGNVYAPGQAKVYQDKAAPIRTGLTSLVNDPKHTTPNSLMDFDYLADDAGSRARLGQFDTLLLDSLASSTAGNGDVSVGAGGVGVSTGKLGAYISNKLGVPNLAAGAQSQAIEQAYASLRPDEQKYVNALMDAMETTPGFRKVTGAGVYEYSITALQRSLPIFGKTGVSSAQIYNDKLMRLVQQNLVGTEQIPEEFLPKTYYMEQLNKLARKSAMPGAGGQRGAAPPGAGAQGGGGSIKIRNTKTGNTGVVPAGTDLSKYPNWVAQ